MNDKMDAEIPTPANNEARYKRHDLATMQQAWAKLDEASDLLNGASLCFDSILAEVATHNGINIPNLVDEAVATVARALTALRGAMDAR